MGELSIFNVEQLKKENNLKVLFETGTLYGDTMAHYGNLFEELHSIEINLELFEKAFKRFQFTNNIHIWHGNSFNVLNTIINTKPYLEGNTLWWLDAHFPGADAHLCSYTNESGVDTRLPLEKELVHVTDHCRQYKDVVIIDDLRIYEDGPYEYGNLTDDFCKQHLGTTKTELIGNRNSDFIYKAFEGLDYTYKKIYRHQGFLVFYPKDASQINEHILSLLQ